MLALRCLALARPGLATGPALAQPGLTLVLPAPCTGLLDQIRARHSRISDTRKGLFCDIRAVIGYCFLVRCSLIVAPSSMLLIDLQDFNNKRERPLGPHMHKPPNRIGAGPNRASDNYRHKATVICPRPPCSYMLFIGFILSCYAVEYC